MAYRMAYSYTMKWFGDGVGTSPTPAGPEFRFAGTTTNTLAGIAVAGAPSVAQITAALAAAQADILTQMSAQPMLGQMQSAATGGPYF